MPHEFANSRSAMRTHAPPRFFPPPESADSSGLIAVGGKLTTEWLLDAYQHGIFPWPVNEGILAWWSPDPRAILTFEDFHVSRRLDRTLRGGRFEVTLDTDFAGVVRGCATAADRCGATWITPAMHNAYLRLFQRGTAHSVETWYEGRLAGGVYGVAIGGMFAAESMFYRVRDASKVALVHLVRHLQARGFRLLDIQQLTPHLQRFGAKEIAREQFLARLRAALPLPVTFGSRLNS